jgi:hypothetical protein
MLLVNSHVNNFPYRFCQFFDLFYGVGFITTIFNGFAGEFFMVNAICGGYILIGYGRVDYGDFRVERFIGKDY